MSIYCAKIKVKIRLELKFLLVRSSTELSDSSFQPGRFVTVPYLPLELLVAVVRNE